MSISKIEENRYCKDCGQDLSVICPDCHGLGYIQPLPSFSGFIMSTCTHDNEYGEYCSKCGARLAEDAMIKACGTCLGRGWVTSQQHYCLKRLRP